MLDLHINITTAETFKWLTTNFFIFGINLSDRKTLIIEMGIHFVTFTLI